MFYKESIGEKQMALRETDKSTEEKKEFRDVFETNEEKVKIQQQELAKKISTSNQSDRPSNVDIGEATKKQSDTEKEMKEFREVTEKDIELAQEFIFKGYAEKEYSFDMLKIDIKLATLSAEEIMLVETMTLDYINNYKNHKVEEGLSEYEVYYFKSMLNISLSLCGTKNKEEASYVDFNTEVPLSKLKTVIKSLSSLESGAGIDADYFSKRETIKKLIYKRYVSIKQKFPIHFTNFVIECKTNFDKDMDTIMNKRAILPKS
jgi:hypothetical protein